MMVRLLALGVLPSLKRKPATPVDLVAQNPAFMGLLSIFVEGPRLSFVSRSLSTSVCAFVGGARMPSTHATEPGACGRYRHEIQAVACLCESRLRGASFYDGSPQRPAGASYLSRPRRVETLAFLLNLDGSMLEYN